MALPSVVLAALLLIALPALAPASTIRSRGSYLLDQLGPDSPEPLLDSRDAYLNDEVEEPIPDSYDPETSLEEAATEPEISAPCPGCLRRRTEQQLSEEELKTLRIEYIKQQILEKLRMTEPPNVTVPRPAVLPEPLLRSEVTRGHEHQAVEQENEDDFYGKTTEVIVFADEGKTLQCTPDISRSLFLHQLTEDSHSSPVRAVYGCLSWVRSLAEVLSSKLLYCVQYRVILYRDISRV